MKFANIQNNGSCHQIDQNIEIAGAHNILKRNKLNSTENTQGNMDGQT